MESKKEIPEFKAKEMAAGTLGKMLATMPVNYCQPVFFGPRPDNKRKTTINSGSISLVDFGIGPVGITCSHVLKKYREIKEKSDRDIVFNVGNTEIDPVSQLIDENEDLDLAVILLTNEQAENITKKIGKIDTWFLHMRDWPPTPPQKNEYVMFGGFPGSLREIITYDEIGFYSWSSGATRVDESNERKIYCPFEREYWVRAFGEEKHMNLNELNGMSGGPVIMQRGVRFDFLGIISEYHENYDTVIFSSASKISADGKIII